MYAMGKTEHAESQRQASMTLDVRYSLHSFVSLDFISNMYIVNSFYYYAKVMQVVVATTLGLYQNIRVMNLFLYMVLN